MELAYLETDVREYEITKAISLVLFDPWALINLKTTGWCIISLPEAFFNQDYPSHYFRRIKTLSLTIPCVTGPYTSVNCTLTLVNSKIRIDSIASSLQDYASDAHFVSNCAATQSITTSTAQNDAGMFEVDFNDERYLPFEGAGAISTWQLDMPIGCNAFDFDSITDVVVNLRYTSRDGGDALRSFAQNSKNALLPTRPAQVTGSAPPSVAAKQTEVQRMFSLKHEYPTEWYKFLNPDATATTQSMTIGLGNDRFPFQYRGMKINISQVELVMLCSSPALQTAYLSGTPLMLQLGPPSTPSNVTLSNTVILNGAPYGSTAQSPAAPAPTTAGAPPSWTLSASGAAIQTMSPQFLNQVSSGGSTYTHLSPTAIDDILMLCHYSAQ
jgi:hypothetical protein